MRISRSRLTLVLLSLTFLTSSGQVLGQGGTFTGVICTGLNVLPCPTGNLCPYPLQGLPNAECSTLGEDNYAPCVPSLGSTCLGDTSNACLGKIFGVAPDYYCHCSPAGGCPFVRGA